MQSKQREVKYLVRAEINETRNRNNRENPWNQKLTLQKINKTQTFTQTDTENKKTQITYIEEERREVIIDHFACMHAC